MPLEIVDQWSDFLFRQANPYADAKYRILLKWMGPLKRKDVLVVGCGRPRTAVAQSIP